MGDSMDGTYSVFRREKGSKVRSVKDSIVDEWLQKLMNTRHPANGSMEVKATVVGTYTHGEKGIGRILFDII